LQDKVVEDETKPFDEKYKAREIIKRLLSTLLSTYKSEDSLYYRLSEALLLFKYGVNFFDSEEFHDAETQLTSSLNAFETLPLPLLERFTTVLQDLYNHLGITHCNRGKNEAGMPFLEKASALYKKAISDEGTSGSH
jgi:predicted component of type VI protein secretion system